MRARRPGSDLGENDLIDEHLRDVLDRGARVRALTGDYLGVTEPGVSRACSICKATSNSECSKPAAPASTPRPTSSPRPVAPEPHSSAAPT